MIQPLPAPALRSLRAALEERVAALSRTVAAELDGVGGEQHTAELDDIGRGAPSDEAAVALLELGEAQLAAMRLAIARIDAGAYGACEDCGGPIAPARLRALPLATRCIACQRAAEVEA